jgi:hypothetical protein
VLAFAESIMKGLSRVVPFNNRDERQAFEKLPGMPVAVILLS